MQSKFVFLILKFFHAYRDKGFQQALDTGANMPDLLLVNGRETNKTTVVAR
jgi:hypothetical protein